MVVVVVVVVVVVPYRMANPCMLTVRLTELSPTTLLYTSLGLTARAEKGSRSVGSRR
jgi:hypothetical protein